MKDRLAQFLKSEELTAVKFAEIMEVQPSSISHLLSGRNKPNFEFISRMLLRFPALNPEWIINGMGTVYKSESHGSGIEVTDVNAKGVTNVNSNSDASEFKDFEGPSTLFDSIESSDNERIDHSRNEVTDGNTQDKLNVDAFEFSSPRKKIERIVFFYSDGSFEDFQN